jgi:hypothetical protein
MTAIEDRHARFLTALRPRLDNLAPLMSARCAYGAPLTPPRPG